MRSEDVELEAILTDVDSRRTIPETPIYRLRSVPTKPVRKRRAPTRRATAPRILDADSIWKHDGGTGR